MTNVSDGKPGGNTMESISQIKQYFAKAGIQDLPALRAQYGDDPRKGVRQLLVRLEKEQIRYDQELQRLEQMRAFEHKYGGQYTAICGIDEAGRGPLAGPVVAGAVILPEDCQILYLNDSKQVSESRRNSLYDEIREKAIAWGVGIVSAERIDQINILQATYEAMHQAVEKMNVSPDLLLVDAVTIPDMPMKQVGIVKGDAKSVSIAAASILAKVTRDRMMAEYDTLYPEYGFAGHKGYGSKKHIEALQTYGPCPIHRKTFITHFV